MTAWLVPPVVSLLVLGAHFFRAGGALGHALVAVVLGALALLLGVRRRWAARIVQVVLLLGAFEWFMTLAELAFWRAAAGEPFVRLVLILGAVAAFTGASTFVFVAPPMRARYGAARRASAPRPEGS